jgi:hypothetical protein
MRLSSFPFFRDLERYVVCDYLNRRRDIVA